MTRLRPVALTALLLLAKAAAAKTVTLDFVPSKLLLDPSGERLLLWKFVDPPTYRDKNYSGPEPQLAMLNVKTGRVVATRKTPPGSHGVEFDANGVYLSLRYPKREKSFLRLKSSDLKDDRVVETGDIVHGLRSLPGNRLVAFLDRKGSTVYDTVTLEVTGAARSSFRWQDPRHVFREDLEDGLVRLGARVVDGATGKLRLLAGDLYSRFRLPHLGPEKVGDDEPTVFCWSRSPAKRVPALVRGRRSRDPVWGTMLRDHPVAVILHREQRYSDKKAKVALVYEDLVSGKVLAEEVVHEGGIDGLRGDNTLDFGSTRVLATREHVIVGIGTRLFISKIPTGKLKRAPEPLHFKKVQSSLLASPDKAVTVRLSASGGKGRKVYRLVKRLDGLRIDPASGAVSVDVPRMWQRFIRGEKPAGGRAPIESFGYRLRDAGDAFRKTAEWLLGEEIPAGKVPFIVPIVVAVADDDDEQDRLHANLVVLGDRAEIQAAHNAATSRGAAGSQESSRYSSRITRRRMAREVRVKTLRERAKKIDDSLKKILERLDAIERRLDDSAGRKK